MRAERDQHIATIQWGLDIQCQQEDDYYMVARAPKEAPALPEAEVETPPVADESADSTVMTAEEQAEFEARALDLAETAIASPKSYAIAKAALIKYEPDLVKRAEEKLTEMLLSAQKAEVAAQMIKKADRAEDAPDFMPLLDELLLCVNRAMQISKILFVTEVKPTSGAGDGQKSQRRFFVKIGSETLRFEANKSIPGAKNKAVTTAEVIDPE